MNVVTNKLLLIWSQLFELYMLRKLFKNSHFLEVDNSILNSFNLDINNWKPSKFQKDLLVISNSLCLGHAFV